MSLVVPFDEVFNEQGLLSKATHWQRCELGNVTDILNGFPLKSKAFNSEDGFPIIRIRDLKNDLTQTFYSDIFPEEYIVNNGDLLIGMDGDFVCYEWHGGQAILNQRVCRILPNENFLLKRFLFYGINGYLKAIQNSTSSITVGHLSSNDIKRIPFPLPPLAEQQRIVSKLDVFFKRMDSNKKRLEKIERILKRFRQCVLNSAMTGRLTVDWRCKKGDTSQSVSKNSMPEIPTTWEWIKLPELGQLGRGKSRHRPRDAKHLYGGKYPFIQTGDVANSGGRITSHRQTYSEEGLAQSKLWDSGTICITIAANIADTALLTYPACFPDSIVGFVPDTEKCYAPYVEFFLRTIKKELWSYAPATAQKNINLAILGDVLIAIPSIQEQIEIVNRIEHLFALADKIESRFNKATAMLETISQEVLSKAFKGELSVQDLTDEPAIALLNRIFAEVRSNNSTIKRIKSKLSSLKP